MHQHDVHEPGEAFRVLNKRFVVGQPQKGSAFRLTFVLEISHKKVEFHKLMPLTKISLKKELQQLHYMMFKLYIPGSL